MSVWVAGATLRDAQDYIDAHPSLEGARATSVMSSNAPGEAVTAFITTSSFVQILIDSSSAKQWYARNLILVLSRQVQKTLSAGERHGR